MKPQIRREVILALEAALDRSDDIVISQLIKEALQKLRFDRWVIDRPKS